MGEIRNSYRVLVGNPEGKRPLGRTRHRWEDNITMNLKGIVCKGVVWVLLAVKKDCAPWSK
jgi:hypothetical protein